MNQQPTIITFSVQDDSGLFLPNEKDDIDHKISIENEPPIIISNKLDLPQKHPFLLNLQNIKIHQSEPALLSPHSILNKSGQISSSPNVLLGNDRRPSLVKFSHDIASHASNNTVFYDTVTEQEKRKKSICASNNSRRPSLMSRISSAYTNKVTDIPFHEIDPFDQHLLQQGIVMCATINAAQQAIQKRPLRWKKYRAVITQSGYLELYHLCKHQERNLSNHTCIHSHLPHYKKAQFVIDLYPSIDNPLFQKKHLFHKSRRLCEKAVLEGTYSLSLMSPIDFSWSLSSVRQTFYFQTDAISTSQQWYQSLYACLPSQSKKPLPTIVDLNIPELSICIRLPISELMQLGEENIDLKKVRDSALVLLHRYGHRPLHWNRRTTGLCWKYKQQSDWVVRPHSEEEDELPTAFLIEARLIEKTHELELHYYKEKEPVEIKQLALEGYLNCVPKGGKSVLYFAQSKSHFLFLFETEQAPPHPSRQFQACVPMLFSKKRNQTSPLNNTSVLKQVIDLSLTKKISSDDTAETLHLDDNNYRFQSVDQPITYWSTRLPRLMRHSQSDNEIKLHSVLYVKSASHRYYTFEKKTCILTQCGLFCILKKNGQLEFYAQLKESEYYVYSGDTCCSHIRGLPLELPCRWFDSGIIEQNDKPHQCCFVVCFAAAKKEYVFLTSTQDQKEEWVGAIVN